MINNRNKSMVKGLDWNSDGRKICIAYEDGEASFDEFRILYYYLLLWVIMRIYSPLPCLDRCENHLRK